MVRFSSARNRHRFGEDVDAIEADTRDMLEACSGIHTSLAEGAINDAEFHTVCEVTHLYATVSPQ